MSLSKNEPATGLSSHSDKLPINIENSTSQIPRVLFFSTQKSDAISLFIYIYIYI